MKPVFVFDANITHNLAPMAREAELYKSLWRPEELGHKLAGDLIEPLTDGLEKLRADPERFKKLNPENGWGDYEALVTFVELYLAACQANPDAKVEACR
jgi:hypothetical protein